MSEAGNERIQEFDSTGRYVRFVGAPAAGRDGFGRIVGVAVDTRGFIYASDEHAQSQILKFGATSGEASGPGHVQSVSYVAARTPGHLFVIDDSRSLLLAFTTAGPSAQ